MTTTAMTMRLRTRWGESWRHGCTTPQPAPHLSPHFMQPLLSHHHNHNHHHHYHCIKSSSSLLSTSSPLHSSTSLTKMTSLHQRRWKCYRTKIIKVWEKKCSSFSSVLVKSRSVYCLRQSAAHSPQHWAEILKFELSSPQRQLFVSGRQHCGRRGQPGEEDHGGSWHYDVSFTAI